MVCCWIGIGPTSPGSTPEITYWAWSGVLPPPWRKLRRKIHGFDARRVIGIGVDTTGSTPIPVDKEGVPLGLSDRFRNNPDAQAWLWKDHTGHAEAREITDRARALRPEYLAKCGGIYSSEWFWSKIWHCLRVAPEVFEAAYTWVEHADWVPAMLSGTERPDRLKRSICAAGHKAMFHTDWGGYPDEEFLGSLDAALVRVRAARCPTGPSTCRRRQVH